MSNKQCNSMHKDVFEQFPLNIWQKQVSLKTSADANFAILLRNLASSVSQHHSNIGIAQLQLKHNSTSEHTSLMTPNEMNTQSWSNWSPLIFTENDSHDLGSRTARSRNNTFSIRLRAIKIITKPRVVIYHSKVSDVHLNNTHHTEGSCILLLSVWGGKSLQEIKVW